MTEDQARTQATILALAAQMSAVLEGENQALSALDLRGAAQFVERKRAAAELLDRARLARPPGPPPASVRPELETAMARLRDLAAQNKTLLERALVVQQRVLGVVVRAVSAAAPAPRYGARGTLASASSARSTGGFALTASA